MFIPLIMVFNCDKCDYQTTRKYNLVLHYKRLTPCNLTKQKKNTSNDVKFEYTNKLGQYMRWFMRKRTNYTAQSTAYGMI